MSISKELNDLYKEVCSLRAAGGDKIHNEFPRNIKDVYENATVTINNVCHYLNEYTNETLQGKTSIPTILVGKESAPLIVSLKQLTDDLVRANLDSFDNNIEDIISNSLSKTEDNLNCVVDIYKSTNKFIQSAEFLIKYFKNHDKLDKLSAEISSFSDKDVVTSSPIN